MSGEQNSQRYLDHEVVFRTLSQNCDGNFFFFSIYKLQDVQQTVTLQLYKKNTGQYVGVQKTGMILCKAVIFYFCCHVTWKLSENAIILQWRF